MVAQKKPEIFDPEAFAALETEFRSGEYYLTLAKPEDYKSVETISINACRNEVSTPLTAADIIWFNDINPDGKVFWFWPGQTMTMRLSPIFSFTQNYYCVAIEPTPLQCDSWFMFASTST